MPSGGIAPTQTLVIRTTRNRSLDPIINALGDLSEQRMIRIVDLRILAGDPRGTAFAVTIQHLWWPRVLEALDEAHAELVSDAQIPKAVGSFSSSRPPLVQLKELNELRRVGTLTEGEFASAKRTLLSKEGLLE